ncbi:MAG: hypothetical protein DME96_02265 [Verrucomicrobia bacterium]|nr:MAG: hypothetical protein DME96_02265 [Verrucomicrobiota bacterium]
MHSSRKNDEAGVVARPQLSNIRRVKAGFCRAMLLSRVTVPLETRSLSSAGTLRSAKPAEEDQLDKAHLERKFDTLWHGP